MRNTEPVAESDISDCLVCKLGIDFLPMLARRNSHGPVCVWVCHKSVFYQKQLDESSWFLVWQLSFTYPILC